MVVLLLLAHPFEQANIDSANRRKPGRVIGAKYHIFAKYYHDKSARLI